jgi:glycine betaine/choline ABC-type transport system substrate-binding protein
MSGWDVKENIVDTNVYKTDGSVTTQSLRVLSEEATSWQQIASRALNYAA